MLAYKHVRHAYWTEFVLPQHWKTATSSWNSTWLVYHPVQVLELLTVIDNVILSISRTAIYFCIRRHKLRVNCLFKILNAENKEIVTCLWEQPYLSNVNDNIIVNRQECWFYLFFNGWRFKGVQCSMIFHSHDLAAWLQFCLLEQSLHLFNGGFSHWRCQDLVCYPLILWKTLVKLIPVFPSSS